MRMSPPLGLVLVAAVTLLASANANAETSPRTDLDATTLPLSSSSLSSSSSYHFGNNNRDQVIAGMEASLLSLLGFTKRPRPQGRAHVPDPLRELHARQNTIGIADIAKPGIHVRSANTVRSFSHIDANAIPITGRLRTTRLRTFDTHAELLFQIIRNIFRRFLFTILLEIAKSVALPAEYRFLQGLTENNAIKY